MQGRPKGRFFYTPKVGTKKILTRDTIILKKKPGGKEKTVRFPETVTVDKARTVLGRVFFIASYGVNSNSIVPG